MAPFVKFKEIMMKKLILTIFLLSIMTVTAYAAPLQDTKNYKFEREIITLKTLGIVDGDENGYFHPTSELKRSEAAKLIVTAFSYEGMEYDQSETEFSDVPAEHWASGYIQAAADMNIINGYGDGNFGPDDNITIEQACAMLVKSLGYGRFAENDGGYPSAYNVYAYDLSLTEKLTGEYTDTITKGELAYMIAMAMEAPMTELTPMGYINIMQGRGMDYMCPMIHYHKAYSVNGHISATSRSNGLPRDYVDLTATYARRLGSEFINTPVVLRCKTTDADAINDVLLIDGEFIIQETGDGEYTILLIVI